MACRDPEYKKFCGQIYRYVPVCQEINKENIPPSPFFSHTPNEIGLVLQVFELGRLLVEKEMIKFYPQGTCMYPCIRPGDALHIKPCGVSQVNVGDITVYRRFNRLFCHRAITNAQDKGLNYIVTRPDTAKFGNDGPVFDDDILGVVTRIQRGGNTLDTAKRDYPLIERFFLNIYIQGYHLRQYLWNRIVYFISYAQQYKFYQKIARRLFANSLKKVDFSLQASLDSKINSRFLRKISPEELLRLNRDGSPVPRWTITLNVDSIPAGFLAFLFRPKDCPFSGWWLFEARIRIRYRATILEKVFLQEADKMLIWLGIKEVFTGVFKDSRLERMFFKNMGFQEISVNKDIFLRDGNNEPLERVIMKKSLPYSTK